MAQFGSVVATAYKRLTLRGLKWDAEAASSTLTAVLKSAAQARLTETAKGKVLIATAANGHTTTFALPQNGASLTPQCAAEMISDLLDRYDKAVATLGGTPTDAQIFAEMMAMIEPVRETLEDFSLIRMGVPLPA